MNTTFEVFCARLFEISKGVWSKGKFSISAIYNNGNEYSAIVTWSKNGITIETQLYYWNDSWQNISIHASDFIKTNDRRVSGEFFSEFFYGYLREILEKQLTSLDQPTRISRLTNIAQTTRILM